MSDTILYASNNTGAILTSTAQGPNGALASPTGTGVVLAASSAIVGTALGGTVIGQVLTWAGSQWVASTPANQSPTGTGVVLASGGAFVSPALPGTAAGQALIWSGSQWVAIAIGTNLIAQSGAASGQALVWGGSNWGPGALNLAGGSNFVSGDLPVANIAPGTNGYVLTTTGGAAVWAAPAASGITQLTGDVTAGPGSGSQAATVVAALAGLLAFTPTSGTITWAAGATGPGLAQASESTAQTPTFLAITPQVSTHATNQDSSGLNINLSAPLGTAVDAYTVQYRGGVAQVAFGAYPGGIGQGIWFGLDRPAINTLNYTFLAYAGGAYLNALSAGIHLSVGNVNYAVMTAAEFDFAGNVALGAIGGGSYGGGAGGVLSIPKAGTNPSSSISTGGVIYADSSTGAICLYPAGVTGWQFQAANGTCYSAAVLQVGTTLAVNGAPTGPGGGGVGVIAMNNATTQPTAASVSGGVALSANAGGLAIFAPSGTVATCIIGNNPTTNGGQGVIALNAAHTNPSANLTSQGALYVDATSGGICLYPASVTAPMLNVSTNSAAFGAPLAGLNATPLQFNFTSIAIGVGGTTTVSAAAALTPKLILSGGTLTSGAILDFTTNAGSFAGATFFCDCTAINGGAALTTFGISFKNGTTTQSLTALPTGGLVIVTISGTNKIAIN